MLGSATSALMVGCPHGCVGIAVAVAGNHFLWGDDLLGKVTPIADPRQYLGMGRRGRLAAPSGHRLRDLERSGKSTLWPVETQAPYRLARGRLIRFGRLTSHIVSSSSSDRHERKPQLKAYGFPVPCISIEDGPRWQRK